MLSSRPLTVPILGLALGMLALAGGCDRQSGDRAQPQAGGKAEGSPAELTGKLDRSHRGSPLPDVTVTDASGKTLALTSLKGPVLLNLWATWCAPCVTELPMLERVAIQRQGRLNVLTVSQDIGEDADVDGFLAERKLARLPAWRDPENDLAFAMGGVLPTTVFYDSAGREVWRMVGGYDWSSAEAARLLDETA